MAPINLLYLLNIFRLFDLLYYTSYHIMLNKEKLNWITAGKWMVKIPEHLLSLSLFFFFCGLFQVKIENPRYGVILSGVIFLLIYVLGDSITEDNIHKPRHNEIVKRFSFITKKRHCWYIVFLYFTATILLTILSGMFYYRNV